MKSLKTIWLTLLRVIKLSMINCYSKAYLNCPNDTIFLSGIKWYK